MFCVRCRRGEGESEGEESAGAEKVVYVCKREGGGGRGGVEEREERRKEGNYWARSVLFEGTNPMCFTLWI